MKLTTKDVKVVENPEFRMLNNRVGLFNSSFQDFKRYGIPKAQLILTDIPYSLGDKAYGSNPSWYIGGDNKNGESDKAGETFFVTDEDDTVRWLKSLRPQSTWKPSEGHLKALEDAMNKYHGSYSATLCQLYGELEKLKK